MHKDAHPENGVIFKGYLVRDGVATMTYKVSDLFGIKLSPFYA